MSVAVSRSRGERSAPKRYSAAQGQRTLSSIAVWSRQYRQRIKRDPERYRHYKLKQKERYQRYVARKRE